MGPVGGASGLGYWVGPVGWATGRGQWVGILSGASKHLLSTKSSDQVPSVIHEAQSTQGLTVQCALVVLLWN